VHLRQQRRGLQAPFVQQRLDAADLGAQAQCVVAHLAQFGLDAVGAQAHQLAGCRQQHAPALALEQLHVERLFQRRHRARDRRRGAEQAFRRAPDAAGGGDGR
jgi:hypothetical protein